MVGSYINNGNVKGVSMNCFVYNTNDVSLYVVYSIVVYECMEIRMNSVWYVQRKVEYYCIYIFIYKYGQAHF